MASAAGAAVIRQHAALTRTTLLPELQLHLVTPASSLWAATADELQVLSARAGVDVTEPFGLFAWPGGQALTRYLLDHTSLCAGARVLDFACGCGSAALAAVQRGATRVVANDVDPLCLDAVLLNAAANGADDAVEVDGRNLLGEADHSAFDVVVAGDVLYDASMATQVLRFLHTHADTGATVLLADPGRWVMASFDASTKQRLQPVAAVDLPPDAQQLSHGLTTATVYQIKPSL